MRVVLFFLLVLLSQCSISQVVRCQSVPDDASEYSDEASYGGVADSGGAEITETNLEPASGVGTVCIFPKNIARLVIAGEETEVLVGVKNDGGSILNMISVKASVHLPHDHRLLVQNLTQQGFNNLSTPASAQATFPYFFAVSKYLQPGTYDLVGTIVYETLQKQHQNVFYNGTIEIVDIGGFLNIESVFLVTLGVGLAALASLWVYSQIQHLSKKTKRAPKAETGTGLTDASLDEWLQGTAYMHSLSSKKKKK